MTKKGSYGDYIRVCQEASCNDIVFANFKRDNDYRQVLEHATYEHGLAYLEVIKNDYPYLIDLIDKFATNDNYGFPFTYEYDGMFMSPTTLRYIKVLGDLNKLFELEGKDII